MGQLESLEFSFSVADIRIRSFGVIQVLRTQTDLCKSTFLEVQNCIKYSRGKTNFLIFNFECHIDFKIR